MSKINGCEIPEEGIYTLHEAAKAIGTSYSLVREWANKGRFELIEICEKKYVPGSFVEEQKEKTKAWNEYKKALKEAKDLRKKFEEI